VVKVILNLLFCCRNFIFWEGDVLTKSLRLSVFNRATKTLLASCAVAVVCLTAPMATAQTFMTEDELLATIPGSSIYSKTDEGVKWAQNYGKANGKRKGAIKGVMNGDRFNSTWYVKGGLWCEDWGSGHACYGVERVDAKSLRMYRGNDPRPNLWKLK
jgi:hypothetical protein